MELERGKPARPMKIGELAKYAGLTVRTLHHYDEIGLLAPSQRSAAGYRLYGEPEIARLLEILLLRGLGLSLAQIREIVGAATPAKSSRVEARPSNQPGLARALGGQIERLRQRMDEDRRLLRQLEAVAHRLDQTGSLSVDDMTQTMEMIAMFEKYYDSDQLDQLSARAEELGPDAIASAEAEWPELIARARAALERGAEPTDPEVREIAVRWKALTEAFTGGDPKMARSVQKLYDGEPQVRAEHGLDGPLFELMHRAVAALDRT